MHRLAGRVALVVALLAAAACSGSPGGAGTSATSVPAVLDDPPALDAAGVARLRPQVLGTTPHDRAAFTEGLELAPDAAGRPTLWEGTGLEGRSQLRELDPATGALRRAVDLPPDQFGEGVTVLPDRIWQLTWRSGIAHERDPRTLADGRPAALDREGWGLCHGDVDGAPALVASDGRPELVVRDPASLAVRRVLLVTVAGAPLPQLNELACTPEGVWANVWQTDHLVRIDPGTGRVTAVVDAAGLLPPADRAGADVLNGVADVAGTDQFLLTGKLWPTTFRVRFVPA